MNGELIGDSQPMRNIKELIKVVANTVLSVIIYGETGVGKEVIARELHRLSNRQNKRFVKVNCAALPSELLESELFGYEKGAFTGATRFKPGKFEIASDGVIFLDEIGDIPLPLQAKLLQVLQNGEFSRLGGKDVKVDTWVISATNHDLAQDLSEGRFREDLYYRLNIIKIDVPPLRERKEDVPLLIDYFVRKYRSELEISEDFTIDSQMMDLFLQHDWPGNVRELSNTIQRLMVMEERDEIKQQLSLEPHTTPLQPGLMDKSPELEPDLGEVTPLKALKAEAGEYIEKRLIAHVLNMTGGNKAKAAKALNISYKALFYKMKNLGLR
ncbi:MAG: sigma-54-dependent Fis family transcriptional regulator [Deltaproteobacteria bacterium]|nr:MAG: sigma-54-dependent Fis family transcriptional regulator [Deltaproteobacteria bacterium]